MLILVVALLADTGLHRRFVRVRLLDGRVVSVFCRRLFDRRLVVIAGLRNAVLRIGCVSSVFLDRLRDLPQRPTRIPRQHRRTLADRQEVACVGKRCPDVSDLQHRRPFGASYRRSLGFSIRARCNRVGSGSANR